MIEIILDNENICSITGKKCNSIVVCKFCKIKLERDNAKTKSKS